MNVNQAWLSKSIGKYYSWLWYHSKNIEFITRGLRPLVINSIFFLVITINTCNIFQYFLTAMHDSFNTQIDYKILKPKIADKYNMYADWKKFAFCPKNFDCAGIDAKT